MKKLLWALAVGSALVGFVGGYDIWSTWQQVTDRQARELRDLRRWDAQREGLTPVIQQWKDTFRQASDVADLEDLYRALRLDGLGVVVDPDRISLSSIRPETHRGTAVGASRFCVQTAGAPGLLFTAPRMDTLLAAIEDLASRPDVRLEGVDLDYQDGRPRLQLRGFCAILRDGGGA